MKRIGIASFAVFAVAALVVLLGVASPSYSETIFLKSGLPGVGVPDPQNTFLAGPASGPFPAAFTAADFAAALAGPAAVGVAPYPGAWLLSLPCDPTVKWISTDAARGPLTALYARSFNVTTCCIQNASLTFCWAADDFLGDSFAPGPNPAGVYVNQSPLATINGGPYNSMNTRTVNITSLLQCGTNTLHIYCRDMGVVGGLIYSARIDITECPVATAPATWGHVKSMYR